MTWNDSVTPMKTSAEDIRQARVTGHLLQGDVAAAAGLTRWRLSQIERQKDGPAPSYDEARKLMTAIKKLSKHRTAMMALTDGAPHGRGSRSVERTKRPIASIIPSVLTAAPMTRLKMTKDQKEALLQALIDAVRKELASIVEEVVDEPADDMVSVKRLIKLGEDHG